MADPSTPAPMDSHWPDPAQLELADKAWDQIEEILGDLVESTGCSNAAIRDLLAHITSTLLDPADEVQWRTRRQRPISYGREPGKFDQWTGWR